MTNIIRKGLFNIKPEYDAFQTNDSKTFVLSLKRTKIWFIGNEQDIDVSYISFINDKFCDFDEDGSFIYYPEIELPCSEEEYNAIPEEAYKKKEKFQMTALELLADENSKKYFTSNQIRKGLDTIRNGLDYIIESNRPFFPPLNEQFQNLFDIDYCSRCLIPPKDLINPPQQQSRKERKQQINKQAIKNNLPSQSSKQIVHRKKIGWVYFIYDKSKHAVKIGMSKTSVENRLKSAKTYNPGVVIVFTIETSTPFELETKLHKKFKDNRIDHSEWFYVKGSLEEYLQKNNVNFPDDVIDYHQ